MKTSTRDAPSLRQLVSKAARSARVSINGPRSTTSLFDAWRMTIFSGRRRELEGKRVLLAVKDQLQAALTLIELDGVAARIVIIPPDYTSEQLKSVIALARVEAVVCDDGLADPAANLPRYGCAPPMLDETASSPVRRTEWVMPTSGTTGAPKLVAHDLARLLGAASTKPNPREDVVWATFYDIRRYGGLQILLRAATSGATLVLSDADEPLGDHLQRCKDARVTHMSGTPSHWRRLLMSPYVDCLDPKYVRLSGEIADRAILDRLRAAYPRADIVHAYASTEAGVGFEVDDGQEGFPVAIVGKRGDIELRVQDGSLRIRSPRAAMRYIGQDELRLHDDEGFVDTHDIVEQRGDRFIFRGRRTGVINIGGLKVHPEEVESVINHHSNVHMSLVKARRSPITGDIIVADVMLRDDGEDRRARARDEILSACRARLARHQVPATIRFVQSIEIISTGKLGRRHA